MLHKILCFFGIHKYIAKKTQDYKPYADCIHCNHWKALEVGEIPLKYVTHRDVQNGDNITLIQLPNVYNSLSNCYEKNAYENFSGDVGDISIDGFCIFGETATLVCGKNNTRVYQLGDNIYKC